MAARFLIALFMVALVSAPAGAQALAPARARAAFDLLKQLAGEWDARSTQQWEGVHTMEIIAGGTAILSSSKIGPHPGANERMATLFHMDGNRLMVTHYCVAGNQPRLVATSISEDNRTIEFTFLDGTNMASRDTGHMDRAIFTIESGDRYRSRWTFFQRGQERWMEDIVSTRRRPE
jgi:hypothetical protein